VYGQGCCYASALRIYAGGYDLAGYSGNGINEGLSVRCIAEAPGAVETLECGGTTVEGPISIGLPVADVNITIPYTGGNGESYAGQTMNSTGVTGLTATLASGNFTVGSNNLRYNVSGIPASAGTAIFSLNIGGQTCNLEVPVSATPVCRAKASSWSYINFMCYNLGAANTAADPFTPSWEINGGYWQWGRKEQAAAGPIGPGSGQANEGAVGGWNTATAPYGSWWPDYKSSSDPCPAGYIVPSSAQWGAVIANNPITDIGTWASSSSNYSSGKKIGDYLMLPAAGIRSNDDGTLYSRGIGGFYWSSTGVGDYGGRSVYLLFYNSFTNISDIISSSGLSVRCIRYYGN
jgi:uncharacterized protein (TIGR02145 family)